MKKLLTIFVALLALGLFALPAMAGDSSDSVTVTVNIDEVYNIDYTGDSPTFTITPGTTADPYDLTTNDTLAAKSNMHSKVKVSMTTAHTNWVTTEEWDLSIWNGTAWKGPVDDADIADFGYFTLPGPEMTLSNIKYRLDSTDGDWWDDGTTGASETLTFTLVV